MTLVSLMGEGNGPKLIVELLNGDRLNIFIAINVWQLVFSYVVFGAIIYWRYRTWKKKSKTN